MRSAVVGETKRGLIDIDAGVLAELQATRAAIEARSLLIWGEHCSECAMPECFASCSLYTPRGDLKCRRFSRGIEGLVAKMGPGGAIPLISVAFRRWGKLEATGETELVPMRAAAAIEAGAPMLGQFADNSLLPLLTRRSACKAVDRVTGALTKMLAGGVRPDLFVLEAINTGEAAIDLTITIRPTAPDAPGLFQDNAEIQPGYNRICFRASAIYDLAGAAGPYLIQLEPISVSPACATIYFGVVDFAKLRPNARLEQRPKSQRDEGWPAAAKAELSSRTLNRAELVVSSIPQRQLPKVKCVVWDLDNVLWSGTLVEDGPDRVRLNPKAAALVVELDRRGILNSIASKNSEHEPRVLLERFGLMEYFLFPRINWDPKSRSIDSIAKALNIGTDTLVFVDDQDFERSEVQYAHPEVEVFDVDIIDTMLIHPRFDVPVTDESRQRRSMYKVEQTRLDALEDTVDDYATFLRSCAIKLIVDELDPSVLNRVFELTERTNQLNYSGRRMSRSELEAAIESADHTVLVLSASDRFGDYGIIGVALLNLELWKVECFFMSCRVQRKRVDHAFFGHLLTLGARRGKARLSIVYRPTARNEPSRVVIEDEMGFQAGQAEGEDQIFRLDTTGTIPDADIVLLSDRSLLGREPPAMVQA